MNRYEIDALEDLAIRPKSLVADIGVTSQPLLEVGSLILYQRGAWGRGSNSHCCQKEISSKLTNTDETVLKNSQESCYQQLIHFFYFIGMLLEALLLVHRL